MSLLRVSILSILVALIATLAPAADDAAPGPADQPPTRLLVLGPLPLPPATGPEADLAPSVELLPEVDPTRIWPAAGNEVRVGTGGPLVWQVAELEGGLSLGEPGVYWLASRLELDRWCKLQLILDGPGGLTLFIDGEQVETRAAAETAEEPFSAETERHRGTSQVLIRIELPSTATPPATWTFAASADPACRLGWTLDQRRRPARF